MVLSKTDAEAGVPKEEIPHDHLFKITGLSSSNLQKLEKDVAAATPADFETAIAATSYGKFNIFLMLCTLPAFWSAVSVTSSVSYIFTQAQCDMHLSLLDMGTVNAITYGDRHGRDYGLRISYQALMVPGMISSAMIWGYLSDTLGRRRIMVWGNICAGVLELCGSISQNFPMLLMTRFASGFLFNGPFAVLISYLAELHRTELRARVILLTSLFYTIANTTLPLLAWAILTKEWHFYLFGNRFVLHAWNFFLMTTATVPILTGLTFLCMPESPKFLMSRGRNEEAMQVFRKIYTMNTGKPKEEFPITTLVEEKSEKQAEGVAALRGGWSQLAPLFQAPHLKWLVLMCVIHMGCMFGSNTIRLWYPQLAAMIGSHSNESLCAAIAPEATVPPDDVTCQPILTDMLTYLQSAIVGAGSVLTYSIGGVLINKCGKKLVAGMCGILSAVVIIMLPFFGTSAFTVMALVTTALAFTSLCGASLSSIAVDLFPTSLRVMALATFLMCGRMGTILGTVTFPALIQFGCLPPFITIASVLAVVGLACAIVPNTTLKRLE